MERAVDLLVAFLLDLLIGDPAWFYHPVRVMGKYIAWFETLFNKPAKSGGARKRAGFFLALSLPLLACVTTALAIWAGGRFSAVAGRILNIFFMWTCLAVGSLSKEALKVYRFLTQGNLPAARKQLATIVSRDTSQMDEREAARACVETAAENASDGIIAPLFYMLLGGAPLGMLYKAVNTMDSMVGYKTKRYKDFGYFPAKLDDILNYIPARLTAGLMIAWAFITRQDFRRAAKAVKIDGRKSDSPNAGYPESAVAGILGVRLGGPSIYFGQVKNKPVIGVRYEKPVPDDIVRTLNIAKGAAILFMGIGVLLLWFMG